MKNRRGGNTQASFRHRIPQGDAIVVANSDEDGSNRGEKLLIKFMRFTELPLDDLQLVAVHFSFGRHFSAS